MGEDEKATEMVAETRQDETWTKEIAGVARETVIDRIPAETATVLQTTETITMKEIVTDDAMLTIRHVGDGMMIVQDTRGRARAPGVLHLVENEMVQVRRIRTE